MKAIRQHRLGGPSVLNWEEAPRPIPGRGEVLIQVRAAGVNPVDAKIRAGKFPPFHPRLPAIIGRDVAGVVRAVGGGRCGFKVGDPVFGMLDYSRGAYAQFAVGSDRELARRPSGLPEIAAGSLGVAALTAWQGLFDHGRLKKGQRVLIHGGAGGVGHLAVQFAKVAGATVITTAGKSDAAWLRSLGADQVIDYKNERFEEKVGAIDLVYDLIAGETQERSWQVLKPEGGRLISTLSQPSAAEAKRARATGQRMVVAANALQLEEIGRLIAAGKVRVEIGRRFPIARVRDAHDLVENGHVRGKVVLTVPAGRIP